LATKNYYTPRLLLRYSMAIIGLGNRSRKERSP
jgi:hypothetical protein